MALDLAKLLTDAWGDHLQSKRRGGVLTRTYLWASGRRECVRRMALDLIHPEDQEEFTLDTLERFERGNEREAAVVNRLFQIGPRASVPFQVIEGQRRFEIKDRDGVLLLAPQPATSSESATLATETPDETQDPGPART